MGIGDDELDPAQAAPDQAFEERRPEGLCLAGANVQADDLTLALGVRGHGDYSGDGDDATHPRAV